MKPSMSRRGNCWDNAPMENFFGHFKEEALRQYPIPTFKGAQEIVDGYIAFYNFERIQLKTRHLIMSGTCPNKLAGGLHFCVLSIGCSSVKDRCCYI